MPFTAPPEDIAAAQAAQTPPNLAAPLNTASQGFVAPATDLVDPADIQARVQSDPSFYPTEPQLRALYDGEQNQSFTDKAGSLVKGAVKGVGDTLHSAIISPLKGVGEFIKDPDVGRLASSAVEGISGAASGVVGMAAKPIIKSYQDYEANPTAATLKRLNYLVPFAGSWLANKVALDSPAQSQQRFQDWSQDYLTKLAAQRGPGIAKSWSEAVSDVPAEQTPAAYPEMTRAVELAASLPMMEAGIRTLPFGGAAPAAAGGKTLAQTAIENAGAPAAKTLGEQAVTAAGGVAEKVGSAARAVGAAPRKLVQAVAENVVGPDLAGKVAGIAQGTAAFHNPVVKAALGMEATGATLEKAGQAAQALAQTPAAGPFGRLVNMAKSTDAPGWLKSVAKIPGVQMAVKVGQTAANVAKGAAGGAAFGGATSALSGDNAEETGENIGSGAVFGAGFGAYHSGDINNAKIFQQRAAGLMDLVSKNLQAGVSPEILAKVPDTAMLTAADLPYLGVKDSQGRDLQVKFSDEATTPELKGQDGYYDPGTHEIVLNADALQKSPTAATSILHEIMHPLMESAVANRPELRLQIVNAIKEGGQTVEAGKAAYGVKHLNAELDANGIQDPAARQAAVANWVSQRDANSVQTYGDPDHWFLSETLAEAGRNALGGQKWVASPEGPLNKGIRQVAGNELLRRLKELGLTIRQGSLADRQGTKPGTVIPGFENIAADPSLRRTVYKLLKAQRDFVPGKTKPVEQAVKVKPQDIGTEKFPVHDVGNGFKGNEFVRETAPGSGRYELRSAVEQRRNERAKAKSLDDLIPPKATPLPANDASGVVALRQLPGGGTARTGRKMPDAFYQSPAFSDHTKQTVSLIENLIAKGQSFESWYHQLGEHGKDFKASVAKVLGNVQSYFKENSVPYALEVTSKGNLLVRVYDYGTLANERIPLWQNRHGELSLDLWNGDVGALRADMARYNQNHAEGKPGAEGIGEHKRDVINALLLGANKTFEANNRLRSKLPKNERSGVIRSFRIDRLETIQPKETDLGKPTYEKALPNFSPKAERFAEENGFRDLDDKLVPINKDGTATLYHWTSPQSAEAIRKTGKWVSKENTDESFFSTNPNSDYGKGFGAERVAVKVPVNKLRINDAMHGEIHFAVSNKDLSARNIVREDGKQFSPPVDNEAGAGQAGNEESDGGDKSVAVENSPVWFSQLQHVIEQKMPDKAAVGHVRNLLDPAKGYGVKPDEVKWTGLDDWLAKQKGSVTKQQVLDYLRENNLNVSEVVKGGEGENSEYSFHPEWDNLTYAFDEPSDEDPNVAKYKYVGELSASSERDSKPLVTLWHESNGTIRLGDAQGQPLEYRANHPYNNFETLDEAKRVGIEVAREIYDANYATEDSTKYHGHVLPGGENYKELLFTLPESGPEKTKAQMVGQLASSYARAPLEVREALDRRSMEKSGKDFQTALYQDFVGSNDFPPHEFPYLNGWNEWSKAVAATRNFKSSHWGEPNVLAHTRFDERTDANGKKTLFLEEIQSDWHQEGRRSGYKIGDEKPFVVQFNGQEIGRFATEQEAADYAEKSGNNPRGLWVAQEPEARRVPDAPFKNTWHEMVFRRMARWAAEHGFDQLAWTTGEQQAERYDLSHHLDSIDVVQHVDGHFNLIGHRNGRQVFGENVREDKLADTVGKDLAAKIIKDFTEGRASGDTRKVYSGLDLKVGGEGMKGFYDKILVDYANKFGKKFGARVENQHIEANERLGPHSLKAGFEPNMQAVHSLLITPEMKASVMGGQALFSPEVQEPGGRPTKKDAETVRKFVEPMFDTAGLKLTLVGSLSKKDTGKDIDFAATPVVQGSLETQLGLFFDKIAPPLVKNGWTVFEDPLERHDGDGWFVSAKTPDGHTVDFYFTDSSSASFSPKVQEDPGWSKNFPALVTQTTIARMKSLPDYVAAKAGDRGAALNVAEALFQPRRVQALAQQYPDAILVPIHAEEKSGRNQIPNAYAAVLEGAYPGWKVEDSLLQKSRSFHTGANAAERLLRTPEFDGEVVPGKNYILVDDVVTSGSTLAALRKYIQERGGNVVAATSLATTSNQQTGYGGIVAIRPDTIAALKSKFDIPQLERLMSHYGIADKLNHLTNSQGRYLLTFGSLDALRNRLTAAGQKGKSGVDASGISPTQGKLGL